MVSLDHPSRPLCHHLVPQKSSCLFARVFLSLIPLFPLPICFSLVDVHPQSVLSMQEGRALVVVLSVLAWVSIKATQRGRDLELFVHIEEPKNLSRHWLNSDVNESIQISVMVQPEIDWHINDHGNELEHDNGHGHGYVRERSQARISVDGTQVYAGAETSHQRIDVVVVGWASSGLHNVTAQLYDSNGMARGPPSTSFFDVRMYTERTHERFPSCRAEAPITDDKGPDEMPGISAYHVGWEGWDDWSEQMEDERMVRAKWGRKSGAGDEPWNERAVFRQYADFHHEVMANPKLWTSSKVKFLIWRQLGGLGNAILSLVSAYAFALVTNRVLLVDSPVMHHLLKRPRGISWHYSQFYDTLKLELLSDVAFTDLDEYLMSNTEMVDVGCISEMQNLLCRNYSTEYERKFLHVHGDQYFLSAILHNRLYQASIRDWFGDDLFGTIARYIISPKEHIMSLAAKYATEHFEGKTSVGIQLRAYLTEEDGMPSSQMPPFAWKEWISSFWKCAYFSAPPASNSSTYFLATDAPRQTRDSARMHLGDKIHWIDKEISRKTLSDQVHALVDIIVLSLCDDIVITSTSTFGNVAAGLSSIVPLVVTFQSACYRDLSSQPCYHKWGAAKEMTDCYDGRSMVSPEVRFCGISMRSVAPAHPDFSIL